jgi:DNA-binding protein HU-beta
MNKSELRDAVAAATDLSGAQADKAVSAVLQSIASALAAGDKVTLPGFGTFETRDRAARQGRNPQTGESMEIAASTSVGFKPAAQLKQAVAKG